MVDFIRTVLDQAGEHVVLMLALVVLFAAADAALGIGVILPGETGIVLAAVALSEHIELLALAVFAAALGAFLGDHFGFAVGRLSGPRIGDSKLVRRLGRDRWEKAQSYVASRLVTIVIARLLPGIRTFVAAAAGASAMPYRRFAAVCGLAAVLWATGWVVGGAVVGNALLELAEQYALPTVALVIAVVIISVLVRRKFTRSLT